MLKAEVINSISAEAANWVQQAEDQPPQSVLNSPSQLNLLFQRDPVAKHELGHAKVARALGWGVSFMTVIPQGMVLGLTKVIPNLSKTYEQQILDHITISAGGEMAEEISGIHDHSGCGSDRFKQRLLASIFIRLTNSTESVDAIISSQRSRARSFLNFLGFSNFEREARTLLIAGST